MGSESLALGSRIETTMRDLFGTICRLTGFSVDVVWDTIQRIGQPRCCLSTTRAEALFDVRAQTPFEEGLRRVIGWYGPTFGTRPSEARRA